MSAIRMVPILLILVGAALFALQNMAPALPLVIFGTATLPLPLALWIGGAIASGAVTTLLISALSGVGRPARRTSGTSNRAAASRFSERSASAAARNPFSRAGGGFGGTSGSTSGSTTRLQDEWETRGQGKDEWDDWEESQTARADSNSGTPSSPGFRTPQPEIRDRTDDDWQNWEGYEDSRRDDRRSASPDRELHMPQRTDFEVKREPATRYQSGSVYSYGYNKSDNPDFEDADSRRDEVPASRPGVYDAEYRVLTPPYRPDPEDASTPQEDWPSLGEELTHESLDDDDRSDDDRSDDEDDWYEDNRHESNRRDRKSP